VSVVLRAEIAGYLAGLRAAGAATRRFGGELDDLGRTSPARLGEITRAAAVLGAGLLLLPGYAIKVQMAFDKAMSEVKAVTNSTADELARLRELALDTGRTTAFTATQAAQAEAELAKAGLSTADILGGALVGTVNLAAAGQMELADAAVIAAQAMNMFHLSGSQVSHVADLFAGAANKSAASMHDLTLALRQGGMVAAQAGWSIEETTAVLAAFADRGLRSADAGTSLKTMLIHLFSPSTKAAGVMKELGLSVYDSSGKMVDAATMAGRLRDTMSELTDAERNAAMATIFGTDAIRGASVLYDLGASGVTTYTDAINQSGSAAKTAATKMDNLAGDVEHLKGSIDTLMISSGGGVTSGLRILTKSLEALVNLISSIPTPITSTITVVAGLAGISLLAAAGFMRLSAMASAAMVALAGMGTAGTYAAIGIRFLGAAIHAAIPWALAIYAAYIVVDGLLSTINKKAGPAARDIDEVSRALDTLGRSGNTSKPLDVMFGMDLKKMGAAADAINKYSSALKSVKDAAGAAVGRTLPSGDFEALGKAAAQAAADFKVADTALAGMTKSGHATQAAMAYRAIEAAWIADGRALGDLTALFPEYSVAAGGAALASSGAAKGFGDASANALLLGDGMQGAIEKGQTLLDVLNQLSGGLAGFIGADIAAREAVIALTEAFGENGATLDLNSAQGRENQKTILSLREAAIKSAQAKYEETGSVTEAAAVWDGYVAQLRSTMRQAGFTDEQINKLVADLFTMPPVVSTRIDMAGLAEAERKLYGVLRDITRLDGSVAHVKIYSDHIQTYDDSGQYTGSSRKYNRWGGITEYAASGLLREASVYSAGSRPRYAFAEPATGGEAFVPKRGNYGRSMNILGRAASWYGASVTPGGGGGGGNSYNITVNGVPGTGAEVGAVVVSKIRQYEKANGAGWRA
jgi:TP901 family phage tail tape measure protein